MSPPLQLTVLGSGTNYVHPQRYPAAHLVESDGQRVLLDCGSHTSRRLLERGLSWKDLDGVIVSHRHPDHIGDLIPALLSMFLAHERFPEQRRHRPLFLHGYPGFEHDYETLRDMMFPDRREDYEIVVTDHGDDDFVVAGMRVRTALVPHLVDYGFPAIGMRVEVDGASLTYSGDTGPSQALVDLARDTDLALFEAALSARSFREGGSKASHLAPQDAARAAAEAGARQLVLTHIYAGLEPEQEVLDAAREHYEGPVLVAWDGLELQVDGA